MNTFTSKSTLTLDYKLWLGEEYTRRCKSNPSYSMRAFAKLLELDSSTISQILSGKRKASAKLISRIVDKLGVDPERKEAILKYASARCKRNAIEENEASEIYRQMTMDSFAIISDWYHYAILELTFVIDFESSPRWIAAKLGITTDEVKIAIARLKRINLIEEVNGKLKKTEVFITNFSEGLTSQAMKSYQKQILSKALDAIDYTPQEEKDVTSMTMSIDVKKLPEARKLIKKFRREMSQFLEEGNQTRVYQLGIQLFPISKN